MSGSVAHGDSVSPTNPGILSSTEHGIHGDRDPGTSGTGISNKELTGQTGNMGESGSVAYGSSISPTNPGILHSIKPGVHGARDAGTGSTDIFNSELMQDSGVGSGIASGIGSGHHTSSKDTGLGNEHSAGPQYTGTSKRDAGLVGSGVSATGHGTTRDESSMNAGSGSGYNPNDRSSTGLGGQDVLTGTGAHTRDTGMTGSTGSGYDSKSRMDRDNTTTGSGLGGDDGMIAGGALPQTGSGYDTKTGGADMTGRGTGSGLTGHDSSLGSGYDSNTRGSGLTGSRGTDTGLTGGDSGIGSGTRDTGLTGAGLSGASSGLTGSRDTETGLTGGDSGIGSGTHHSGKHSHTHGTGLTGSRGTDTGLTGGDSGIGSGYDSSTRDTSMTGGGLTGSGTGSGLTGTHHSGTHGTGLTGEGTTGSGLTGGDSGLGSGTTSSSGHHTGLVGKAEQFVEKHHPGDGHPEDIVHPGPHVTQTAKALDPHMNP